MKIVFAGNKERGVFCLEALRTRGHDVAMAIVHTSPRIPVPGSVKQTAIAFGIPVLDPEDVNAPDVLSILRGVAPDVIVLAGYGPIVGQEFIECARKGCINLHGGKLPEYRGSSPMNWALINGETEYAISVIMVDKGVDTGDVLAERRFPIAPDDTIADLQDNANSVFPGMLCEVLEQLDAGTIRRRKQDESSAAYYPLRFPDDGLILWDMLSAAEIHNRIRALTSPYPGAFAYMGDRKVKLLESKMPANPYFGTPGRIYRRGKDGLLVCARDRCVRIRRALFEDDGRDALGSMVRYQKFLTVTDAAVESLMRRHMGEKKADDQGMRELNAGRQGER